MARVNLEERLFADDKVALLGKMLQSTAFDLKNKALGIGVLALLWHSSQQEKKVKATHDEIANWFAELADSEISKEIISALIKANFLRQSEEKFLLRGNKDQVESLKKFHERASKGGKAKAEKKAALDNASKELAKNALLEAEKNLLEAASKQKQAAIKQANYNYNYNYNYKDKFKEENTNLNTLTATPTPESPIMERTTSEGASPSGPQKNLPAVLENSQKPEKPKKADGPSDGSKVWQAYAMAYEQRMRVQPIRNAKQNALCSQLVQRLGLENAVKIAAFYLTHPNHFYMQNKYPLGLLVKDCEGIYTEFLRGDYVTQETAKRESIQQENRSELEKFMASRRAT